MLRRTHQSVKLSEFNLWTRDGDSLGDEVAVHYRHLRGYYGSLNHEKTNPGSLISNNQNAQLSEQNQLLCQFSLSLHPAIAVKEPVPADDWSKIKKPSLNTMMCGMRC